MKIEVIATIENKVSKSGKEYTIVNIPITEKYSKKVFLDDCEQALFESITAKGDAV